MSYLNNLFLTNLVDQYSAVDGIQDGQGEVWWGLNAGIFQIKTAYISNM